MATGKIIVIALPGAAADELESTLNSLGHTARTAATIAEARILLAHLPAPDLAFSGLALPDGNWRDFTDCLRQNPGTASAPVILCAPFATAQLWWDALEHGVVEIASPPFCATRLQQLIQDNCS